MEAEDEKTANPCFPVPRFQYAFTITLTLGEVYWVTPSNLGSTRGAVYVTGGMVEGPDIHGIVIPQSGADWPLRRPDGVLDFGITAYESLLFAQQSPRTPNQYARHN